MVLVIIKAPMLRAVGLGSAGERRDLHKQGRASRLAWQRLLYPIIQEYTFNHILSF